MPAKIHPSGRIVFDASTMLRWTGAPVGIVRVVLKLSQWARRNVAGTVFVFFDPERQRYRALNPDFSEALLEERAAIDTFGLTNPARPGQRRTDAIPRSIKPVALWSFGFRTWRCARSSASGWEAAIRWLHRLPTNCSARSCPPSSEAP